MQLTSNSMSLSGVTRSYLLFILLLLLGNLLYGYNTVNGYLSAKQNMLSSVARLLQQRIETYRFITYQIYETPPSDEPANSSAPQHELRLRPDIYLLDKARHKTDALIFGLHDSATSELAQNLSRYLDTLWSANTEPYSLYYLNGQDNSLILISTMPMKDLSARYKDGYLGNLVEARKAEMLQQSNALDQREGFSRLRKFRFQNAYYFTLRTTFNDPGHLATVIAFDLPVEDLLPSNLPAQRFQLREEQGNEGEWNANDEPPRAMTQLSWPWITINSPIHNTPLTLQFHIPAMALIIDLARNNFWVLLINLALLVLSAIAFYIVRHQYVRPGKRMAAQLNAQQEMNQEIIAHLPMGLLIYRFDNNTLVASNKQADQLLPHLSLHKIAAMADRHHGKVQVSINNAMYEVQMVRSQQTPHSALFLIRNLDTEVLMSQKLKLAHEEYEKNLTARKTMTDNLSHELQAPLRAISRLSTALREAPNQAALLDDLWLESQHAQRLIDEITLLTAVESQDWHPQTRQFRLHEHIDALLLRNLPAMRRKGLMLLGRVDTDPAQQFDGDIATLERVLEMLLHYAIVTTAYGKISLTIGLDPQQPDRLHVQLSDTGAGLTRTERRNLHYPALSAAQSDRFTRGSSLTFYLCAQLCRRLDGELTIDSRPDIGTHYRFTCRMHPLPLNEQQEEKLLEGITIGLRITAEEIHARVSQRLEGLGATLINAADEGEANGATPPCDLLVTDDPALAQANTLLLAADVDGFEEYAPQRIRANFNLSDALIDAILLLIERQMAAAEPPVHCEYAENAENALSSIEENPFKSKDYYSLFLDTVPADIQKLYTESDQQDWPTLALTAHRLKGVFAMLAFPVGKKLCEQLEEAVKHNDAAQARVLISHIDAFVSRLLQLGNQQYE
ncbi:phosphotransferase RcsD [Edwardsiella tarda]|uniref:phosphotransferase RcsD n=1 Tax=Edwardsiella tarda TaxID=636 RepID=UPI001CEC6913|nr:phosphotransferase RcsD [Edwardsiella tarda]AKH88590.2 phosphotransferase RcsD [Edwardsiella tarda]